MIKLIGAALIITASALMGIVINMRLYKRQKYLESIIAALEQLKVYICFSDYKMERSLLLANSVCDTGNIFKTAAENLHSDGLKTAWNNAISNNKDKLCLTDADAEKLSALGDRLGKTDSDDQRKNIDNVISTLRIQCEEAQTDYKKNGRLYRSCSVLCGTLAALMLL